MIWNYSEINAPHGLFYKISNWEALTLRPWHLFPLSSPKSLFIFFSSLSLLFSMSFLKYGWIHMLLSFLVLCTEWKWVPHCYLVLALFSYQRGVLSHGSRSCRKHSGSALISDWLSIMFQHCCPVLSNCLTRIYFFFHSLIYYVLLCCIKKCKTVPILTSHSNHSVKVRWPHYLLPHQPLCHLQAGKMWYWHLHSR